MVLNDIKYDFADVLLVPKRSEVNSRSEVDITREIKFKHSGTISKFCPIIAANLYNTGTFAMAGEMYKRNMLVAAHKFYTVEDWKNNEIHNIFPTIGLNDFDKYGDIIEHVISPLVCIDVPNGYIPKVGDLVKRLRDTYSDGIDIIVGNVVTPNMVEQLILDGADVVKVGIGSGGLCTTRLVAGVGYPQLSAIIDCADAAHGLGGHIISDGGITCVGDICKAFCAGADFVMVGSLFVGYEENEGDWYKEADSYYKYIPEKERTYYPFNCEGAYLSQAGQYLFVNPVTFNKELDGKLHKAGNKVSLKAFGMSSKHANDKFAGGLKDYRASEGREKIVNYKGPVAPFLQEIEGGLRSCGAYIGAKRLKDFPKCATFVRCNRTHNRMFEE